MPFPFAAARSLVAPMLVTSRHSAIAVAQAGRRAGASTRPLAVRLLALMCGSTLIGTSVALLVHADLGLPSYDVLSSGLAARLGLSLGQAGWLVAAVLFAVASMLGHRPTLWSGAFILGNGLAVDGLTHLVNDPETMLGRVLFVLAAVSAMALAINLVIYSGTTGGPFELLMNAAHDRGISRIGTRYALDFGVLALGIALGGSFGPGTIVHALLTGVLFRFFAQVLADHEVGRLARTSPTHSSSGVGG